MLMEKKIGFAFCSRGLSGHLVSYDGSIVICFIQFYSATLSLIVEIKSP